MTVFEAGEEPGGNVLSLTVDGTAREVLVMKQAFEPAPPSTLVDVPPDLDNLAIDLLRIDPAARPSEREILRRLGVEAPPDDPDFWSHEPHFIGRKAELATLQAQWQNEVVTFWRDVPRRVRLAAFIPAKAASSRKRCRCSFSMMSGRSLDPMRSIAKAGLPTQAVRPSTSAVAPCPTRAENSSAGPGSIPAVRA